MSLGDVIRGRCIGLSKNTTIKLPLSKIDFGETDVLRGDSMLEFSSSVHRRISDGSKWRKILTLMKEISTEAFFIKKVYSVYVLLPLHLYASINLCPGLIAPTLTTWVTFVRTSVHICVCMHE